MGSNMRLLQILSTLICAWDGALLAIGDWSSSPEQIEASCWPEPMHLALGVPTNTRATCSSGLGRTLDYGVASEALFGTS